VIENLQLNESYGAAADLAADLFKKRSREGKMREAPIVDAVVFAKQRLSQPLCAKLLCATSEILSCANRTRITNHVQI
jgi:hypothetical protein